MDISEIFKEAPQRTHKRGDIIYRAGEEPTGVYFVESGLVGLAIWGEGGKDHLVRLFRSGYIFGHRSLFANENYHASATVLQETRLRVLTKSELREKMKGNCELAEKLLETLARELRVAESKQVVLTEKDVSSRIGEALVYLKDLHPDHNWTRQEVADFCGSTAPTVIRTMAKFEENGWIQQNGREFSILDRDALIEQ